ncbi:MAG: TrkH family potassium uptake protein [Deferribacterales bacterium]
MRFLFLCKILAFLIFIVSVLFVIPAFVSMLYNDIFTMKVFLYIGLFTGAISLTIIYLLKGIKFNNISSADGMFLVSLGWIIVSLVGALPFYFGNLNVSFFDAFFESVSGFTTTGATIFKDVESLPKGILFWRSFSHWLGGMGIVVLAVAVFPLLGIGGMQLIKAEAPGPSVDKLSPRIATTAKYLWMVYIGLTIIEAFLLFIGGMDLFDAVNHTFATLATGGFSTKNSSIMTFNNPYFEWVIAIFMILAGANFALHYKILMGNFSVIKKDSEFKFYIFIIVVYTLLIGLNLVLSYGMNFEDGLRHALFQVATIHTTTGFASADYEKWPIFAQALLFALMFVGGCSGSTGGGIKVIRILTLLKQALNEMKYLVHPRGIFVLKINGKSIRKNTVYAISGFFFLYMITNLLVMLLVSFTGVDIVTSLSAALACVGNIGPGFGSVGPMDNYSFFSDFSKFILSIGMLAGRLEIYTFFIIFTPYYWRR